MKTITPATTPAITTMLFLTVATASLGQSSNIAADDKLAWGENIGFTNWADANGRADGVRLERSHLRGFVWGENVGWINTGSGPTDGIQYANDATTDKGVNVDANGDLFGFAWGENIGWVNFDTRASLTPFAQQARYDADAKRLRGYAWGENVGWLNLDSASVFVGVCFADVTTTGTSSGVSDGVVDLSDFSFYLSQWAMSAPDADITTPGVCNPGFGGDGVDLSDFSCYLSEWAQGCP